MQINFTKMHGLGNDFVVIDAINQSISLTPEQIRSIADRHFGVGCDQLLLVEKSPLASADFKYRIFNADGSEVEQCGNGARCFARFVQDEKLTQKTSIPVITATGLITLHTTENGLVTVDMGVPKFNAEAIPLDYQDERAVITQGRAILYPLKLDDEIVPLSVVSMGNPHAIIIVDSITDAPVEKLGTKIQQSAYFPQSVNVGFMQIIDAEHIALRVYERGVGETMACGTGACAAVVAGRLQGLLEETVDVNLPGGNLSISWADEQNPVMMTGPATTVFKGTISL